MEWFKHDTSALNDAKIKKLIIRYGVTGYAIYFHCIELIAGDVNKNNLTFELEHDSEIIADNLKIKGNANKSGIEIVEEIMRYIIELNLFQENENRIFCLKLLKRIDSSMTSNTQFRKMINDAKEHHDWVMTGSCKKRIEKNRIENIYIIEILEHWNTKNLQKHKKATVERKIQKKHIDVVNDYGVPNIKSAIDNYDIIVNDSSYYYNHSGTFWDFLSRYVDNFLDDAQPHKKYKQSKSKKSTTSNSEFDLILNA